jgi:hypothetical protein
MYGFSVFIIDTVTVFGSAKQSVIVFKTYLIFVCSKSIKVRFSKGYGKTCKLEYMKVRTYVTRRMLYFSAIAATPLIPVR